MHSNAQFKIVEIFTGQSYRLKIVLRDALFIGCILLFSGCDKHKPENPTAAAPPSADAVQNTAPAPIYNPPPAQMPTIAASPDGGADLRQLNHVYIGWIVQNRRRPKNFEDFVSTSGIQVPPAPAGKKYVIDQNGFIALINQ